MKIIDRIKELMKTPKSPVSRKTGEADKKLAQALEDLTVALKERKTKNEAT